MKKSQQELSCNNNDNGDNVRIRNSDNTVQGDVERSTEEEGIYSKVKGERYGKLAFCKHYKGPKMFFLCESQRYRFKSPEIDLVSEIVL